MLTYTVCGVNCVLSCSFCVVLLVPGPSAYNDSLTAAFRRVPLENKSALDSFAYIDSGKQTAFLSSLQPVSGVVCPSGERARPVSLHTHTLHCCVHLLCKLSSELAPSTICFSFVVIMWLHLIIPQTTVSFFLKLKVSAFKLQLIHTLFRASLVLLW